MTPGNLFFGGSDTLLSLVASREVVFVSALSISVAVKVSVWMPGATRAATALLRLTRGIMVRVIVQEYMAAVEFLTLGEMYAKSYLSFKEN